MQVEVGVKAVSLSFTRKFIKLSEITIDHDNLCS